MASGSAGSLPGVLDGMDLEALMDVEVTTAARKEQTLARTPAAAFVINRDDIRRSGAQSIPEALRLAPGVEAAQIRPGSWSVTIRGFAGRFANKLLVLVDGRSVYTESFGGVYWDMQDLLLDDIERIEVIRGPGATLWGSNAVNGVINIITRHSSDTRGGVVELRAGDARSGVGGRWGGALSEGGDYRVYFKADREAAHDALDGGDTDSGFSRAQLGWRADWRGNARDHFTLRGDLLRTRQDIPFLFPALDSPPLYSERVDHRARNRDASLVGRWERSLAVDSEFILQVALNSYRRDEYAYDYERQILDLDFQHRFNAADNHDVVWGLGYRYSTDRIDYLSRYTYDNTVDPYLGSGHGTMSKALMTFSGFIQDDIGLIDDRLRLTLGTKVEHTEFTGLEWQPNARLLWTPDPDQTLWASVARAVRTPTRADRDVGAFSVVMPPQGAKPPVQLGLRGNPGFDAEALWAYELGWRAQLADGFSLDLALYYNDYDDLREATPLPPAFYADHVDQLGRLVNGVSGHSRGVELAADWHPAPGWRVQLSYNHVVNELRPDRPRSPNGISLAELYNHSSPSRQLSLRAGWTPRSDLDLDLWLRAVDEVPLIGVFGTLGEPFGIDGYVALDARLAWRPNKDLELSLVGRNLLDSSHGEYADETWSVPLAVPRSVMAGLSVTFR